MQTFQLNMAVKLMQS